MLDRFLSLRAATKALARCAAALERIAAAQEAAVGIRGAYPEGTTSSAVSQSDEELAEIEELEAQERQGNPEAAERLKALLEEHGMGERIG